MTTAARVAEYLVWHSQTHGDPITNLKLQKLLYYAQGWHLAIFARPLFSDQMQAWPRGPVQYGVWKSYSQYKWTPISRRVGRPSLPSAVYEFLDEVMQVYGRFSALELEQATHRESPWINARKGLAPAERSNAVISTEDMRAYFTRRLRHGKAR